MSTTEATQGMLQNGQDNPASDVANLIAHLTNSAGVNGNGPIEQMLARMPPHESASVLQQYVDKPGTSSIATQALEAQQAAYGSMPNPFPADPGPSSHPNGPPLMPVGAMPPPPGMMMHDGIPPPPPHAGDEGGLDDEEGNTSTEGPPPQQTGSGGRRGARAANVGSDEWARQRKDNHKEVERRRRGNINDGINELGRIVPNGSGEKAKGAILSRAVQYIHHLKENEARNIEKWTLEKLLMDQAMGDLQSQLDEMRRLWEEERAQRSRAEAELELLRGLKGDDGMEVGSKRQRIE
ncbi:hypothetical protein PENSPDRAFT_599522 [Peniophora sp. CONT]|nr:hypothetical protein PENSPDRAFT_599522 [Peniophora sp. CONT]